MLPQTEEDKQHDDASAQKWLQQVQRQRACFKLQQEEKHTVYQKYEACNLFVANTSAFLKVCSSESWSSFQRLHRHTESDCLPCLSLLPPLHGSPSALRSRSLLVHVCLIFHKGSIPELPKDFLKIVRKNRFKDPFPVFLPLRFRIKAQGLKSTDIPHSL